MAREVEIHLKTAGAQEAAQEVERVEKGLGQLGAQASKSGESMTGLQPGAKALEATANAADEASGAIDQTNVSIIDYADQATKASEASERSATKSVALSSAMAKVEAAARRAGQEVEAARRAAERKGELTELQKVELEFKKLEAEAKALDRTLARLESRKLGGTAFARSIASGIERRETQMGMLAPRIDELREEEKATRAAAEAAALEARKKAEAAENSRKLREESRKLAEVQRNKSRVLTSLNGALSATIGRLGALGPLLRSVLNPWALLATAAGVATAAVVKWWKSLDEGARESQAALEEAQSKFEEFTDRLVELDREAGRKGISSWVASLKEGVEALQRENEELERNFRLKQMRREADMAVERSRTERELAELDAMDLPEEEKIRRREAIVSAAAERELINREEILREEEEHAAREAAAAKERAAEAMARTDAIRRELEVERAREQELARVRNQLEALQGDGGQMQVTASRAAEARAARDRGNMKDAALAILPFGNIGADRREAARNKAVEEAEEAENEARRRWTLLTRQLRELERDVAQAEELRKSLEEAEKEEAAAVEAANRSGRIAEEATTRRVTEQPRMREVLENQTAARRVQAEKEIADRRKAEEEKQRRDREAEESKRRAEQERMEKSIVATGGTQATSAARSLGAPDRAVRQLETLGMTLQSDPSAENLGRFEKMLEQLLAFAERRNEADSAAAERVRRLEARVESLRIQQSKLRDGK